MEQSKGAPAPFFLSVCSPKLRDDALLGDALRAFQAGKQGDALVLVEGVCRRHPNKPAPAMLRAKIVQEALAPLASSAWYAAWYADPQDPVLQDQMLLAWLADGALGSVVELGLIFLPGRCLSGTQAPLVHILSRTPCAHMGACWRSGEFVEGVIFDLKNANKRNRATLTLCSDELEFSCDVPASGELFRVKPPSQGGVWSLVFAVNDGTSSTPELMQGSPLVFRSNMGTIDAASSIASTANTTSTVNIVIPVYQGLASVRACLSSVLTSLPANKTVANVIVINDHSPDVALSDWLNALALAGHITLISNRHNLGFIEASNRGLSHAPQHDALLLNADTLVSGDWLDQLRAALYSAPDIASVTPWSNNAEISSFPQIVTPAPEPTVSQLVQLQQVASQLRKHGMTSDVDIPNCCGFAMLMRRSVINQIGMLDGASFTRGYLEEVDWCLRARAAGYRHLLATGAFVAHAGSASFRAEKRLRVQQNRQVLESRYPDYYPEYGRFLKADPLKPARAALKNALQQCASSWLAQALAQGDAHTVARRPVPAALAASCVRIAVWQHRLGAGSAGRVLKLARVLASQSEASPTVRLLVIGEASEALWKTGVVDVVPMLGARQQTPLSDTALVGLGACAVVLTEHPQSAPSGLPVVLLDAKFDPTIWLAQWLPQQGRRSRKAARIEA